MAKIILLNKPFQVLSQFTDSEGRANRPAAENNVMRTQDAATLFALVL